MTIDRDIVLEYTRQNTGKHMLDSGGEDGRLWQQPAPTQLIEVRTYGDDFEVALTLTGVLTEYATLVEGVREAIEEEYAENESVTNFDVGPLVMERLGYHCHKRGNTYNWGGMTDLSQGFVYEVWHKDENPSDSIYLDDAVVLVYSHNGADVRGGYARPIPVVFACDTTIPYDLTVEFGPVDDATSEWLKRHGYDEYGFDRDQGEDALREAVGDFIRYDNDEGDLIFANPHAEDEGEPATLRFYPRYYMGA